MKKSTKVRQLNSSLLGYSVLMITNLIDKFFTWAWCPNRPRKQALQSGMTVFMLTVCMQEQVVTSDQGTDYWRSRSTAPRLQVVDLKEQLTQDQEPRWSEEQARMLINAIDFTLPRRCTRVCIFLVYSYRFLYRFCQEDRLKSHS